MDFIKKDKRIFIFVLIIIALFATIFYIIKNKPIPQLSSTQSQYHCPSIKEFCTSGHDISKDGAYLGFGATLEQKSPIFASFDGVLTSSTAILSPKLNSEGLNTLYLDNDQKNLRAIYYFKGDTSPTGKKVKKGEQIGSTFAKIESFDVSLIFQIIQGDIKKEDLVKLTSSNFQY